MTAMFAAVSAAVGPTGASKSAGTKRPAHYVVVDGERHHLDHHEHEHDGPVGRIVNVHQRLPPSTCVWALGEHTRPPPHEGMEREAQTKNSQFAPDAHPVASPFDVYGPPGSMLAASMASANAATMASSLAASTHPNDTASDQVTRPPTLRGTAQRAPSTTSWSAGWLEAPQRGAPDTSRCRVQSSRLPRFKDTVAPGIHPNLPLPRLCKMSPSTGEQ